MSELFNTLLYQPIFNALIFIYNVLPLKDMGIAIIILTIVIKLILWPLSKKTVDAQKKMKELQPQIDEINKKYKDDKGQRAQELMRVYKENKANPASSCLPLLLQLPILWAVFRVFRKGFEMESLDVLYSFVSRPESLNNFFLGITYFNLAEPNILLTILTAGVQFWQTKMLSSKKPAIKSEGSKDEGMQAIMNKQMVYIMPAITLLIGLRLPSGLMLYWLVSTLIMGLQQWLQFRDHDDDKNKAKVEVVEEEHDKHKS